ncbi:outer membrane protein assembly factor BamB family protein [Calycomorphotria hydatis]|uniref:Outer membrane biogenesis protein BamB n=1 Tax=Calycomorphotria hydatis TaxID=2528027 RepID=A0A517T7Y9_9PLAN|nr:PQQ-binding-like beta-propeller repeat protein [Calycomorphotria hydatis]QDT64482.1 outer membrane biogenesis protein BamB [Calycomorphotria hydatis]
MRRITITLSLVISSLFIANTCVAGDLWPSFLGVGTDLSNSTPSLTWSNEENVAWTANLPGYGQSSPIIQDGVVYLTQVIGPNKEENAVVAIDLSSGEEKWRQTFPSSQPRKSSVYVSKAAPTGVADTKGFYSFFESGDLIALSPAGEELWTRKLTEEFGEIGPRHGLGGSLAQIGDQLILLIDQEGPSFLMAIDKSNGKTVWKTDRETGTAWSSPIIMHPFGDPQIVISAVGSVAGYDGTNGKELWRFEGLGGNNTPSPMPYAANKFLLGASAGRSGEDTEGADKTNGAFEIVKEGDTYTVQQLWKAEKSSTSFNSPAAYQGYGYWVNRVGALGCYDLETGEMVYQKRVASGSCWATPLGVAGHIYFPGKTGKTSVLKAGPEFDEVAVNELTVQANAETPTAQGPFGGVTFYAIAAVGNRLLLRSGQTLHCISKQAE